MNPTNTNEKQTYEVEWWCSWDANESTKNTACDEPRGRVAMTGGPQYASMNIIGWTALATIDSRLA